MGSSKRLRILTSSILFGVNTTKPHLSPRAVLYTERLFGGAVVEDIRTIFDKRKKKDTRKTAQA